MTEIVIPGAGLVYMKVGTHANEPFDEIFERKRKEIEDEGFALWGYGGNTGHRFEWCSRLLRASASAVASSVS